MKVKSAKTKNLVAKSNWAEDELSVSGNTDALPVKKKKASKKISLEKPAKAAKKEKVKKKRAQKPSSESSDEEEYGGAMSDKLKEIDPEFYKVIENAQRTVFHVKFTTIRMIFFLSLNST